MKAAPAGSCTQLCYMASIFLNVAKEAVADVAQYTKNRIISATAMTTNLQIINVVPKIITCPTFKRLRVQSFTCLILSKFS